jgi:hypothetical protein
MTRDDVLRMARDSGCVDPMVFFGAYERFANLVYEKAWADTALAATHTVTDAAIAKEREACAKVCEEIDPPLDSSAVATACAAAIRARSNP